MKKGYWEQAPVVKNLHVGLREGGRALAIDLVIKHLVSGTHLTS